MKQHAVHESMLSGVHVDCEVYNLFSDLLPAGLEERGGELQWGRSRQGIVPDLKLLLQTPEGPQPCLAEIKQIGAGKTWFPRGWKGKGADKRASLLTKDYKDKVRKYDVRFHGASPLVRGQPEPAPGPLLARLRNFGPLRKLVAGPWGNLSSDFHKLLRELVEAKVEKEARARGRESSAGELGKAMGETRIATSVVVLRGQQLCLLERLSFLGPGVKAAGEKRALALRLQERRKRDAQAYCLAHDSRGTRGVGRAFVEV